MPANRYFGSVFPKIATEVATAKPSSLPVTGRPRASPGLPSRWRPKHTSDGSEPQVFCSDDPRKRRRHCQPGQRLPRPKPRRNPKGRTTPADSDEPSLNTAAQRPNSSLRAPVVTPDTSTERANQMVGVPPSVTKGPRTRAAASHTNDRATDTDLGCRKTASQPTRSRGHATRRCRRVTPFS